MDNNFTLLLHLFITLFCNLYHASKKPQLYKSKTGLVRMKKFLMLAWCQEHHELKYVLKFYVSLSKHSVWIFEYSHKIFDVRLFVFLCLGVYFKQFGLGVYSTLRFLKLPTGRWYLNQSWSNLETGLNQSFFVQWWRCQNLRDVIYDLSLFLFRDDVDIQGRIGASFECGVPKFEDLASVPVARVASGMQSKPGVLLFALLKTLKKFECWKIEKSATIYFWISEVNFQISV